MKLQLLRFSSQSDSTSGILFDATDYPKFLAYTLEDEYRAVKVHSETRIPAMTYNLGLRTVGGFDSRYEKKFGSSFHKGMIHLLDVPNFQYVLLHIGNTDENTAGCILVGDSQENNMLKKDGFIGSSTNAYKRIYPAIAEAILNGGATLEIIDYDSPRSEKLSNKANDDVMLTSMVDRKMETIIKDLNTLKGIMLDKNYKIT